MIETRTLSGRVHLREGVDKTGATLRVKLEDVSRIDASATLIAEVILPITQPLHAGTELPFTIVVPDMNNHAHYNVRAHVDLTGSGDITKGDHISTAAYPVLTQGNPDIVTIEAIKI